MIKDHGGEEAGNTGTDDTDFEFLDLVFDGVIGILLLKGADNRKEVVAICALGRLPCCQKVSEKEVRGRRIPRHLPSPRFQCLQWPGG